MPVIIKDFQVVAEEPQVQRAAEPGPPVERRQENPPPSPKKLAQTWQHLQARLARVHAN